MGEERASNGGRTRLHDECKWEGSTHHQVRERACAVRSGTKRATPGQGWLAAPSGTGTGTTAPH
jgi:hypothetical protein